MQAEGWISLYRGIKNHWIWEDKPFSKGAAWVDLLLSVNHQDKKKLYNGTLMDVKRGSIITSIVELSKNWGWSRIKTTSFLELLEKDGMITRKSTTKNTTITIVNYEKYQYQPVTEKQQKSSEKTAEKQQKSTNNNDNNDNNINNIKAICTEAKPPVITFLLNDNSEYEVTENDVETFQQLYPALDIMQELRSIKAWCLANTRNRKTRSGAKRFINGWLSRTQNSAKKIPESKPQSQNKFNDFLQRQYTQSDIDALERALLKKQGQGLSG